MANPIHTKTLDMVLEPHAYRHPGRGNDRHGSDINSHDEGGGVREPFAEKKDADKSTAYDITEICQGRRDRDRYEGRHAAWDASQKLFQVKDTLHRPGRKARHLEGNRRRRKIGGDSASERRAREGSGRSG